MKYIKYPRTFHLPWSEGATNDDKILRNVDHFVGTDVVVTEKMDGENTTLYTDHYHARSIDSRHHPSRDWLAAFHATISSDIPEGWRICGENVYAQHSIRYENLESYFLGFSVWNENNVCLSWEETKFWFDLLGITPVRELYVGPFDEARIVELQKSLDKTSVEGYVVRSAKEFQYSEFANNVAKFVRPNHVQTDKHWMHSSIVPNKLKESN